MKNLCIFVLSMIFLLTSCTPINVENNEIIAIELPNFSYDTLNDEFFMDLLMYDLAATLEENDEIIVDSIQTQYIPEENIKYLDANLSQEYRDELADNTQENIYFGYKLSELDDFFGGLQYVFTVVNGNTVVIPLNTIISSYNALNTIIKNTSIGAGVILLCVTISIVTGGAGTPVFISAVNVIFTFAAKSAASGAAIGIASGGLFNGAIELGNQLSNNGSVNWNDVGLTAAVGASEGFKWGAIIGSVTGGLQGGYQLSTASRNVGTYAELKAINAGELAKNGESVHHVLPNAASNTSRSSGLSIKMADADHRLLTSTGSSREAVAFRAEIKRLIDAGKMKEAYTMGFDDIIFHTGNKYIAEITRLKQLTGLF